MMGASGSGRRRGRRAAATATAAALALVLGGATLAGCGGGGGNNEATSHCPAAPGVTPTSVTIGLLYPASGQNAETFGSYRAGVDARLGVANAAGGVHGRRVSYTWADDEGRADMNYTAAQRLAGDNRIFVLQEFSPSPQGSAKWLNQRGVPVVGTSNNLVWSQYRNMFSYLNIITPSGSVSTWGDYAREQGAHRSAVLYSEQSDGSRLVGAAFRASLTAAGIPTQLIDVEPSALDLGATVEAIRRSGADLITGILDGTAFFEVAAAARQQIPSLKILSLVGYDPAILFRNSPYAGMTILLGYAPFEQPIPAHKAFLDAMAHYAPEQQPSANEISLSGWMDADLLLRGLQVAGSCPTRQSFMTNLRKVSHYDAGGLLAQPVDMGTIFGRLTTCYAFLKISPDGTRFVPQGSKPRCGRSLPTSG